MHGQQLGKRNPFISKGKQFLFTNWSDDMEATVTTRVQRDARKFKTTNEITGNEADV